MTGPNRILDWVRGISLGQQALILLIAAALLVAAMAWAANDSNDQNLTIKQRGSDQREPGLAAGPPGPSGTPAPTKETIPGDGIYLVGEDIQPGTYSTTIQKGAATWQNYCYWARLGGPSGTRIIAGGILHGELVVDIDPSDVAFETRRCADWTKETP